MGGFLSTSSTQTAITPQTVQKPKESTVASSENTVPIETVVTALSAVTAVTAVTAVAGVSTVTVEEHPVEPVNDKAKDELPISTPEENATVLSEVFERHASPLDQKDTVDPIISKVTIDPVAVSSTADVVKKNKKNKNKKNNKQNTD
jgi:hypothetical protein